MKNTFTKKEMIEGKGCYSLKQLMALPFMQQEVITLVDVLTSDIPLKDKGWMVWSNCQLILDDKKKLSLQLAWLVLSIYEEKYPNDRRIRECNEATESFSKGLITEAELKLKRNAAVYAAADAADAATSAAYAAVYAADAVNAADAAAYAAVYADVYADAADADDKYVQKYINILLEFVK